MSGTNQTGEKRPGHPTFPPLRRRRKIDDMRPKPEAVEPSDADNEVDTEHAASQYEKKVNGSESVDNITTSPKLLHFPEQHIINITEELEEESKKLGDQYTELEDHVNGLLRVIKGNQERLCTLRTTVTKLREACQAVDSIEAMRSDKA